MSLAAAHHERCLADPVLNHPFAHGTSPDHIEHLASYWMEVFGGPSRYSESLGGQVYMISLHAGTNAEDDLAERFAACFAGAIEDAGLPDEPAFRTALRDYMDWAVRDVHRFSPGGSIVPEEMVVPRWSWDGLVSGSSGPSAGRPGGS